MTDRRPEFHGEMFDKGLAVRREVLGDAYVEKSLAAATDYSAPLQKLITEWCWGEVWTRPGLERRLRSVLNLGMTMALNRPAEFKTHARGALNNGLTREELVEIVLQGAIYCGAPASLDAMRLLQALFDELDTEGRT
ncbi:carboxymuconolactone decarboxylase family protein [Marinibaculum pumilum]|uniref:Carboxymuconolactone decarboxylase family protein n=1 Tax=Marinibaculum pumilum TaxID=1766165 RepID=A0ABV7KWK1_9PROT